MTTWITRAACAGLLVLAACAHDATAPTAPTVPAVPQTRMVELHCTVQVTEELVSCEPAALQDTPGRSYSVVLGGQGVYVLLASSGTAYDAGTEELSSQVTIKNLIGQAVGTTDGTTLAPEGVRVFFASGPAVTDGTGVVEVVVPGSPDGGTDLFTASNQPYYQYNEVLATGETSAARTWRFRAPPSVLSFTFGVYVSAAVQYPDGWIELAPGALNLNAGQSAAVTDTVRDRLGRATAEAVTWSSSDTSVATVSTGGVVSAVAAGSATVTASSATLAATVAVTVVPPLPGNVRVVNHAATGANNGTSWADAYTDLQSALAAATSGQEIWVAAGTYTPSSTGDQNASFALRNGVALYGGFAGTEYLRAERDWSAHVTVLSGDLTGDDADDTYNFLNNSRGVVTGMEIDATAVLDGFTITGGTGAVLGTGGGVYLSSSSPTLRNLTVINNTVGGMILKSSSPTLTDVTISGNGQATYGGGMWLREFSSPTLRNVTITGNTAVFGGGMNNWQSSPTLINVTISYNRTQSHGGAAFHLGGGGMFNSLSSPTLINVTMIGNTSSNGPGGAIRNEDSSPTLINVTIASNQGTGAVYNLGSSAPVIRNSIIWGNGGDPAGSEEVMSESSLPTISYSLVRGGFAGTGNLNADPLFVNRGTTSDPANQNFRLAAGSPAIGAGNNSLIPSGVTTDFDGNPRIVNGTVDMGAYERQ